ncbi:MAG: response regulator transcription factor [Planctomycetota bacterium]|nr:response regulator transcription factor [Planctomycetota bacterium]
MRILLIEDSRKLLDSLRLGLTKSGYEVDTAADGETGLRMARGGAYDVVVLDLMLPGLPGLDVLRRLRENGSDVHVLVLTALDAVEDRVRGLRAGADDYLAKPFSFDELLARLQALTRRQFGVKTPLLRIGDLEIDTAGRVVRRGAAMVSLTHREYRLLEYLAFRRGETVSRMEIEEHLYGTRSMPLSNVVDSAICSIRTKLKRHGEMPLIHTRPRLGYVLSEEAP